MNPTYRKLFVVGIALLLIIGSAGITPVKADPTLTFNVNSFADANDFATNSVCSVGAATGGPCTLRAAIAEANGNVQYENIIITLPAGTYDLTLPPVLPNDIQSGDLNIISPSDVFSISLIGTSAQPAVINANQLDRVFNIGMNTRVNLTNIVIRSGLLSWTGTVDALDGAGILNNHGTVFLDTVIVEDNEARCGQETCEFYIAGGGILNLGTMVITDSTIRNNSSESVSAIFNTGTGGYMFIENSTISGNQSSKAFTMVNYAYLHIRNSTISGNTAGSAYVAGIANYDELVIEETTIANAGSASSIYSEVGASVTIQNSILYNIPTASGGNCYNYGTWTSNGYNIFSDNSCPATGTGDLSNTDPLLGTLGYWGGPTMTMPLQTGSPARNHRPGNCTTIPSSAILPPETLTIDQRHYARADGLCDSGAFEGILNVSNIFLPILFR